MTFKGKLITGLAAATGLLLVVAVMSYSSFLRNAEDRQWVLHTYEVIGKLDGVLRGMTDAETSQRGYILTGEDPYLEPYEHGLGEVRISTADVRRLTADNINQQHSLDLLEPLLAAKVDELRDRIQVRQQQGLTAG